ncbi:MULTISPECIES: hypothetical protein [Flavobacterium]|uniref:Lipoprotein n=1 Tax=Flavobacterium hankyongi TaxID=1176532 RepID=A0ABP8ZJV5_9FLAO|nr:hypothetical protein [Flavobacterium sp. N1846]
MKFLKQFFKVVPIIIFSLFLSCKENEVAKNNLESTKIDTVATVQSKDTLVEASATENKECLLKSTLELPYSKKIDINKIKYSTTDCKFEGIDELLCDSSTLRYIALPNFENSKVILVPVDCGDFDYRFFLATIFENKLLSKLYVEGEWHEPGDDSYKEITSFSIDEDYIITVTKKSLENGKNTSTESLKYSIDSDGSFVKQ